MPVSAGLSIAPAIAGTVANAVQAFGAGAQEKKDQAELKRLKPAFYKIQDEYFGNRNSAAEMAQGGFTQGAKDLFSDQLGRGLGTAVSGTLQAGGSPNDIASIFGGYNDAVRNFAAEDSQKQIENIRYFHKVNTDLAGQKTMQWDINEYQPYQNKLKELTQRIAADKQNKWNAVQGAIGSAQAGVTALSNNSLMNSTIKRNDAQANLFKNLFANKETGQVDDPFKIENVLNPGTSQDQNYNWYNPNANTPAPPIPGQPASQQSDTYTPDQIEQITAAFNNLLKKR